MTGRKTLCTPETIKAITDNIILGMSNRDACALSGIDASTFYIWLQRGEAEHNRLQTSPKRAVRPREAPFLNFFNAIKKAIPQRKQSLILQIRMAAREPQHWQAAAWLLERIHPDEFARKDRLDVTWQREAERLGIDVSQEFQQLIEKFADLGDSADDGRRLDGVAEAEAETPHRDR